MRRATVAKVQVVDPLSPTWKQRDDALDVGDDTIMLAFLNTAAGDSSILDASPNCRDRLVNVVTHIAEKLHAKGTLAIPMESTWSVSHDHIDSE